MIKAVAMSRWDKYPKPSVLCVRPGLWEVEITRGFEGNYEHEYTYWDTWRDAYQYAYGVVKGWRK